MPDYSLTKNNNSPQTQPSQVQYMQTPISKLSSASQQAKLETENALLREALAMSAQNCEVLMKQSNQSLEEIKQTVNLWIGWLKKEKQKNQEQLKHLESMNEIFSKNLNDVLAHTSGELVAELKKDVDNAIKSNIQAMENTIKRMERTASNVTNFEKELKTTLAKRINIYNSSINKLFKLDDWRQIVFWAGMTGGILTPIVLILGYLL